MLYSRILLNKCKQHYLASVRPPNLVSKTTSKSKSIGKAAAAKRVAKKKTVAAPGPIVVPTAPSSARQIIMSLDLGEKNFAYCVMDKETSAILDWSRLNLEQEGVKTSNIESTVQYFESFIDNQLVSSRRTPARKGGLPAHRPPLLVGSRAPVTSRIAPYSSTSSMADKPPLLSNDSVVLVENQVGSRLRAMQAVCFALFKSKTGARTLTAYPRHVHTHFKFDRSSATSSWYGNKKQSIQTCALVLRQQDAVNGRRWLKFFQQSGKQDDLADCFLQALWYYETNRC